MSDSARSPRSADTENPAGLLCPLCGERNRCAVMEAGGIDVPCWCIGLAIDRTALACIPKDQIDRTCLCPRCAAGIAEAGSVP